MKAFNVNSYIYVQITEEGFKYLKETVGEKYIRTCISSRTVFIKGETYYRLQFHEVFDLLPFPATSNFQKIGMNILFDEESLLDF